MLRTKWARALFCPLLFLAALNMMTSEAKANGTGTDMPAPFLASEKHSPLQLLQPGISPFPNLVAAGDATTNSIVLWANPLATGTVTFAVSPSPSFDTELMTGAVEAVESDLPVKWKLSNLSAGTLYYFQATDSLGNNQSGRFRTCHSRGARHGLRFGVSGDGRGDLTPFSSIKNVAARHLDFFVNLGDTIYGDVSSPVLPNRRAMTLSEFRSKHAEVLSSRYGVNSLAELRASTVYFAVIDDHEVINDFAGGASPVTDPRFDTNGLFINETVLFRNGLQAFDEYHPIAQERYETPSDLRTHGKMRLYRTREFGSDAAMFLLDARSFRDKGLKAITNLIDIAAVNSFLSQSFDPNRTMLGKAQINDLKRDLWAAQTNGITWKFVLVPEPIQNIGVLAAADRFEGYAAERTELLSFIDTNQIENVVFIAADVHGTLANNLTYQLGPGAEQIQTTAFEVSTGPVAYDAPFGPTIMNLLDRVDLGAGQTLLSLVLQQLGITNREAFGALDRAAQNAALVTVLNQQMQPFRYSPVGLEDSPLRVRQVSGSYANLFGYGWTEFEIDQANQDLTVRTYSIPWYRREDVSPGTANLAPELVSEFVVSPFAPTLKASRSDEMLVLRWTGTARDYKLQSAADLSGASWIDVTGPPRDVGYDKEITIDPINSVRFYRLFKP